MSKTSDPSSDNKKQLLERLQRHPELMERVEAIVGLTESSLDQISTPNELEILLQEQLRLLGKASIEYWGAQAEQEAAEDFKNQNPDARYGKKNPELVWHLRIGLGDRTHLAHRRQQL